MLSLKVDRLNHKNLLPKGSIFVSKINKYSAAEKLLIVSYTVFRSIMIIKVLLKVARTIADLAGAEQLMEIHIAVTVHFRNNMQELY